MARIQSVSQKFRIAIQATREATQKVFVETARREHARVMATDPKPTHFEQFVDGVRGAPIEAVKADGRILFRYPRLEQVVRFAMEKLFDLSPVQTGDYRMGHRMFINGNEVSNLATYRPGDEILITNYLPYARKIEVGAMKMRVPGTSRVYEQAVSATNRRFGNVAKALFTWRGVVGGVAVNPSTAGATVKQRTIVRGAKGRFVKGTRTVLISGGAHNKSDARFPAMLIREL